MKPDRPHYYSFTFRPSDAGVILTHNWEDHPAFVRYHSEIASENPEPHLFHGYAYRIKGGWRLTDWEHKTLEDPFIKSRVLRKLREAEKI